MSYNPLPQDINGNVLVATGASQTDIVGTIITGNRTNSVIASFEDDGSSDLESIINVQFTGSGSATKSNGNAIFSSGTSTSASVTALTYTSVKYNPGYEIYLTFSATYTTPTSANSSQFVGGWDISNNGLYVGYNGVTFGCALMTGGSQTFVPRTNWNGDLLTGSPTSKFTRMGTPEAINFTYLNLFRIRFSWWGAAPIVYEVMSPDGQWIVFHTIYQPNTSISPSIRSPNLPLAVRITKTSADATNLIIRCGSLAAGTSAPIAVDVVNYNSTLWSSLTTTDTALEASALGAASATVSVSITGVVSAGVVTFEYTPDGTHWFPVTLTLQSNTPAALFSSYSLIYGNFSSITAIGGYLKIRARLSTTITGSGSVSISIRPSVASLSSYIQVYQPSGTNLHAVIDSGTVSIANSTSTGNAPAAASIGITSTVILASNTLRKGLVITNTSNRMISFGLNGAPAVLNSGITLLPGGTWIMDSYTFTSGAIAAIASGAAASLSLQEMQ